MGTLLAGIAVVFVRALQGNTEHVLEALAFFPMAVVFAAIPAIPFGFIVGSVGSFLLAIRAEHGVSGRRLYGESAAIGAVLGATFPLILTVLGWGPLHNLVWALPISIGIGTLCAILLIPLMRKHLPFPSSAECGKGGA